MSTKLVQCKLR